MEQEIGFATPSEAECHQAQNSGRQEFPGVLLRADIKQRKARLADVIAGEIVPRLLLIHQARPRNTKVAEAIGETEINDFGPLVMAAEAGEARLYFERMRARGHSLETLFVHLLAPTARYLGELWNRDLCDFVDVTIGVARLQELLSIFGEDDTALVVDDRHRALLITTPGEKHFFGVNLVAKLMRGAGWHVKVCQGSSEEECVAIVAREWFGVAGVTLSAKSGLVTVAHTIGALRRASFNQGIGVMVGGPAYLDHPEFAVQVGADAFADDAPAAVIVAKKLLIAQAAMGRLSRRR